MLSESTHPTERTATTNAAAEAELQRLETGKWRPRSIGGQAALAELFADDFLSVEYGPDLHGVVTRKDVGRALFAAPDTGLLVQMLDATEFVLSEWRFVHLTTDAVLISYRVHAPAFTWTAYATSVWARRVDRWRTVFYQASRAAPSESAAPLGVPAT